MFRLFCFSLLIACSIVPNVESVCPRPPASDINTTRIAGRWYVVQSYPDSWIRTLSCIVVDYNMFGNQNIGVEIDANEESGSATHLSAVGAPVNEYIEHYVLSEKNFEIDIELLGTDYDNYEVSASCGDDGSVSHAWIKSRTPELDSTLFTQAQQHLIDNNIPIDSMINIDQSCNI